MAKFARWNEKVLLLLGCVLTLALAQHAQEHGRWVFTEKDAGKTLKVSVGDTVVVKLPAIPGNGYVWHLASADGVAKTKQTRFELLEKGQPGARAAQVFQLVIVKAGQHELPFSYRRGEEVARTCTLRLDAR